jgi:hypothetical protein
MNTGSSFAPPGALATGALDVGACSVADEVPPAAKAPGTWDKIYKSRSRTSCQCPVPWP